MLVQVALVFPNNDPAASMVAFYGCLLAEVVPVPIEVPLTRKVNNVSFCWNLLAGKVGSAALEGSVMGSECANSHLQELSSQQDVDQEAQGCLPCLWGSAQVVVGCPRQGSSTDAAAPLSGRIELLPWGGTFCALSRVIYQQSRCSSISFLSVTALEIWVNDRFFTYFFFQGWPLLHLCRCLDINKFQVHLRFVGSYSMIRINNYLAVTVVV